MVGTIKVGKLQAADGTGNTIAIESGHLIKQPGSIVQVVTNEVTSISTFSSASYTQALSINFTPKFSNSLVKHHFWGLASMNNRDYNVGQDCRWLRDSTVLSSQSWTNYLNREDYTADFYPTINWHYVDTPNTTSQVTYIFQGRSYGGNGSNHAWSAFEDNGGTGNRGQWTIEEVAQ